jgi:hypothetical protein
MQFFSSEVRTRFYIVAYALVRAASRLIATPSRITASSRAKIQSAQVVSDARVTLLCHESLPHPPDLPLSSRFDTLKVVSIVTVSSWTQLVDELYKESWDESIHRFRSPFVFRGVPDAAVDLSTTLMRLAVGHEDISSLEGHILRNFRKYAHSDATLGTSIWNWLAIAQHHGLQTRLLDWTYSPFVAMHFMTADLNLYDRDGVIWCINHRVAKARVPDPMRSRPKCSTAWRLRWRNLTSSRASRSCFFWSRRHWTRE